MRTIIELTPEQVSGLDRYTKRHRVSRAAAVREAVERLLQQESSDGDALMRAFGAWKRGDEDAVEYQRRMRAEWDRDGGL